MNQHTNKHNCKADTTWKSYLCETSTRREPVKKGRNRGQLFRPYWDSSTRCNAQIRVDESQ